MTLLARSKEELRQLDELDRLWGHLLEEVEKLPVEELTLNNVFSIVEQNLSDEQALQLVARDLIEAREGTLEVGVSQE